MKHIFLLGFIFCKITIGLNAQTGIGTTTPHASAKLDVTSSDKGFLPTRMTSAQRTAISSPAAGLMVYQTDGTSGLYYYNGTAWIYIINSTTNVVSVVNGGTGTTTSTGTGSVVLNTSPTLITPALGTPSSATLTNASGLPIASGVSGLGTGVASFLATPTSSNLASAISDETGSGALVFGTSPSFTTPSLGAASATSIVVPTITGGSGTTQSLIYRSTSGNGTTGADHIFQVGNNGGTEAMRILNNGNVGIGTTAPSSALTVGSTTGSIGGEITINPQGAANEGAQITFKRSLSGGTADWTIDHYGTSNADARFRIFGGTSESNVKATNFIGTSSSALSAPTNITYGDISVPQNLNVSSAGDGFTNLVNIPLPSSGTYRITYVARVSVANSATLAVLFLRNGSNAQVSGSEATPIFNLAGVQVMSTMTTYVTTSGAETYKFGAWVQSGAGNLQIINDGNGRSKVLWEKIQ
ncbi:MAG: hypothetical protein EBZ95_06380 [Chitinophagia bacterium]|nr:hypothetical protein [Chitinophagia bacterium]